MGKKVDLNSDLGESFGLYKIGNDENVLKYVTSANIACGMHAGDPVVMSKTVKMATENGVGIGAHPGYPDLQGFGRRNMNLTPEEITAFVVYQVGALQTFAKSEGQKLQHVKAHGALYNMAAKDIKIARAIAEGIKLVDPNLIFMALAGSKMVEAAQDAGLKVAQEIFADRAYNSDGTLVARGTPGAMIHDKEVAIPRVVKMVTEGKVTAITGEEINIQADSICVHGDNPEALKFVEEIREALVSAGVEITRLENFIK
jgi:UPF0271 protein